MAPDAQSTTGAARRRLFPSPTLSLELGAGVEDRHRAAVLRPARYVVADRDRPFLAVGNRAHAMGLHAARDQIVVQGRPPPGAKRDIVFARAALVGVAFDDEAVLRVAAQPLRLLVQG